MGGPASDRLALAGFRKKGSIATRIRAIFSGKASTAGEAGVALLGGHTVQIGNQVGYAVTGAIDPTHMFCMPALRRRRLFLTKSLGTGVVAPPSIRSSPAGARERRHPIDAHVESCRRESAAGAAPGAVHAAPTSPGSASSAWHRAVALRERTSP